MLNKWIGIGNLGRDPVLKYTSSGKAICEFSIAVDGGGRDKTEWVNVKVWEKLAENCNQYLAKGSMVAVEGRMSTESWEKDGQKHYKTVVVAHNVRFLNKVDKTQSTSTQSMPMGSSEVEFSEDEIPF